MNKNVPWIIGIVLFVAVVMLLASGTLSIKCDSDELNVPKAVDDAGDKLEEAVDDLTED